MGNTLLSYPDYTVDNSTALEGGSWSSSLPLANLQNNLIRKVAESTDALAASTQWVETFSIPRDVRVIGILGHNITLAGTIRVRGYSDAGLTTLVCDTGIQYAWPQTFSAVDVAVWPNNWIWPLPAVVTAKYWEIEIVDTANPAGVIRIGRCWLGPAFEPLYGVTYGAELGYESFSTTTRSLGGVPWHNRKTPLRGGTISFPALTKDEEDIVIIMQKTLDTTGEILFVLSKTAPVQKMLLRAFPCTPRSLSKIRMANLNASEYPMDLLENA